MNKPGITSATASRLPGSLECDIRGCDKKGCKDLVEPVQERQIMMRSSIVAAGFLVFMAAQGPAMAANLEFGMKITCHAEE